MFLPRKYYSPDGDGGGAATNEIPAKPAGAIELEIGGKKMQFANMNEVQAKLEELNQASSKASQYETELQRLQRLEKLAKATVHTGTEDAERQFYEALGLDDREIAGIMSDEEEEEGGTYMPDNNGQTLDINTIVNQVVERLQGKIGLKSFDEDTFKVLKEIADRSEHASRLVSRSSRSQVQEELKEDAVVGKYWGVLTDRQKKTALETVLKGTTLERGRIPSDKEMADIKTRLRSWLTDVYGPVDELRKQSGSGVPSVLDIGADSTGMEGLSDQDLANTWSKLNSPDSKESKGPEALGRRMHAALELAKRKKGR